MLAKYTELMYYLIVADSKRKHEERKTMRLKEINQRFTEIVADFISKGYINTTTTMNGSQGEISKIDLTDGVEIIRVVVDTFSDWRNDIEGVSIEEVKGEQINAEKLKAYIENDMITEFDSAEECLEYFNTYDFQNFQSVEELKRYQDKYGFGYGGKWYHINYDEALDVYEKR